MEEIEKSKMLLKVELQKSIKLLGSVSKKQIINYENLSKDSQLSENRNGDYFEQIKFEISKTIVNCLKHYNEILGYDKNIKGMNKKEFIENILEINAKDDIDRFIENITKTKERTNSENDEYEDDEYENNDNENENDEHENNRKKTIKKPHLEKGIKYTGIGLISVLDVAVRGTSSAVGYLSSNESVQVIGTIGGLISASVAFPPFGLGLAGFVGAKCLADKILGKETNLAKSTQETILMVNNVTKFVGDTIGKATQSLNPQIKKFSEKIKTKIKVKDNKKDENEHDNEK